MGSSSTHAEPSGAARVGRAPSASAASTIRRPDVLRTSDADEETMTEVRFQVRPEDLLRRGLHVVLDAPELEQALFSVVDDVAGARVVVTRLPDRPDADDVLPAGAQLELVGDHLVDAVGRERERLAEMGVADQRERREIVPDLQALRRLIAREDVVELLDVEGRPVAVVDVALADLV